MHRPIVVVGSVNLDLVCMGKRIPAPGETVRGDKFQTFHGGKGANQAVAVARLGYPVAMIAKVGSDDFGKRLRQGLQAANVNVRAVSTAENTASGVALISVDRTGQNSITVIPGANDQLLPGDLEKALPQLQSAGIILSQLEIPMETVEYLCSLAQRLQIPLMLDPAPARSLSRKLLKQVTFLTPNETETSVLCAISPADLNAATVDRFATFLLGGAANVIVKMGRHGAYLASADGIRKMIPAFKVKAVDSTAAGDAFNAGLAVGLMEGKDLVDAVVYGAAVGALSTTRPGAQKSMPAASEVGELLASHNGKVSRAGRRIVKAAAQAAD
ncbi:MAG TPA: ribokinase [Terracidiphilus sp.]|nr:ribokinase [Terracidiphilus sp.]